MDKGSGHSARNNKNENNTASTALRRENEHSLKRLKRFMTDSILGRNEPNGQVARRIPLADKTNAVAVPSIKDNQKIFSVAGTGKRWLRSSKFAKEGTTKVDKHLESRKRGIRKEVQLTTSETVVQRLRTFGRAQGRQTVNEKKRSKDGTNKINESELSDVGSVATAKTISVLTVSANDDGDRASKTHSQTVKVVANNVFAVHPSIIKNTAVVEQEERCEGNGDSQSKPKCDQNVEPIESQQLCDIAGFTSENFDDVVIFCAEYADDHFNYLFHIQKRNCLQPNFLVGSKVSEAIRMAVIDWMCQLQTRFRLLAETFYVMVNLFDQYVMRNKFTITKKTLQVVAAACVLIASKYEEIYPPEVIDLVTVTGCKSEEILKAEINILCAINFDLRRPRVVQFVRRLTVYYSYNIHVLSKAIGEIVACDYSTCHLLPSTIAAVSVFLAAALEDYEFPEETRRMARVSALEIRSLVPLFARACLNALRTHRFTALRAKLEQLSVKDVKLLKTKHLLRLEEMIKLGY